MKKHAIVIITAAAILLSSTMAIAGMTAKQIVEKSKIAMQGESSMNKVQMTMINKRGDTLEQKMVSRAKTKNGLAMQVTTFLYPDETKGTKFLMVENKGREADMKIFIPELKRVRTISTSQRNQSYMGSDFAYGDLEALEPEKGEHSISGEGDFEGAACHLITTVTDPKKNAGYSKLKSWIRKDNFIAVKTEFYDKDGQLKKVKTIHDLYQEKGSWVLKKMVMENVQKKHKTIILILESKITEVDDSYFTEQFLRQTDKF